MCRVLRTWHKDSLLVEKGKRDQKRLSRVSDLELSLKTTVGRHPQTRGKGISGREGCGQKAWELETDTTAIP